MAQILPNDIVEMPDGTQQRLLAILGGGTRAWLILLDAPRALPHAVEYRWLLANAKPVKHRTKQQGLKSLAASATAIARRDAIWNQIAPLVVNPAVFVPSGRAKLLREQALTARCSENTLLRNLRRYWQRGQSLDALLPDFANIGGPATGPRGRKTKDGQPPYILQESDKKALNDAITGHYLKKEYYTLMDSHQWMLEQRYTYLDGNGKKFIKPDSECPSPRQLRFWLHKNFSLEQRLRSRKGDKDFERDHRHKLGSIQLDCHGAGHLFEIDATIVDCYLVSSTNPKEIVGKPTLYLVIDRATRLIVGWYVGFENASWMAAMQAILSIAEDKSEICKRYGVDYDPADWPAHGIQPEQFLADQGEMASKNAKRVSTGLRSTVSNVPGLRPDWKPLVECGFKMTHQLIAPDLPAYDPPSNQQRRRGKKYHDDAMLNLEQFTSLIVKAIVTHNRTMQVNFDLSIQQVADDVRPIPIELWNYEVQSRAGALARFDVDTVRMELLPRETASVTEHGVALRHCLYTFPEGEKKGWFIQARQKRFKVVVSLDYRRCDEIEVHDPDRPSQPPYRARLVKSCEKFAGMSFADVELFARKKEILVADADQLKRQNKLDYHQHSQTVIAGAKKALKAASDGQPFSRSARRKDIAHERKAELARERERTTGMPSVSSTYTAMAFQRQSRPTASAVAQKQVNEAQSYPNRPLTTREKLNLKRQVMAAI